jgi:hypothetical protein
MQYLVCLLSFVLSEDFSVIGKFPLRPKTISKEKRSRRFAQKLAVHRRVSSSQRTQRRSD